MRILSLPELTPSASLRWATCFGEHPGHALFSKNPQQHPPPHPRPLLTAANSSTSSTSSGGNDPYSSTTTRGGPSAPRRRLRSVPKDGIISVVMQVNGLSGYFRTIDLSVRCRTLLGFTEEEAQEQEQELVNEDTGTTTLMIPWETWGPANTRILEHDSLTWGSLVGERRATVGQLLPTRITMRDYNPFRVRRALEVLGGEAGKEVELECGSVVKVVEEKSSYRGGEWFSDDIESSLPYVETVTPYEGCEGIFMDEDNLLAEVRNKVGLTYRASAVRICN